MRFTQKEVNLHTHTLFSHHGEGMPEDYLREAEKCGRIKALGFSEHAPLCDPSFPKERMRMDELESYRESVRTLESGNILVLLGAECDWRKDFESFYRDELVEKLHFDYLLGSVHMLPDSNGELKFVGKAENTDYSLSEYVRLYTQMLSSRLFLYGCHPDIFMASHHHWDDAQSASRDIIECAVENNMPLEINGNGMRKKPLVLDDGTSRFLYPVTPFWEMALGTGAKIVTSSDAHRPQYLDSWSLTQEFASPLKIKWAEYEIDPASGKIAII